MTGDGAGLEQPDEMAEIYRSYEGDYSKRWSMANPGNRAIVAERESTLRSLLSSLGIETHSLSPALDLGSGTGESFPGYFQPPTQLIRLDLLFERLLIGRRADDHAALVCADGVRLPFADDTFDLVIMATVLSSIVDPSIRSAVVSEARRVTRTGGAIVCYDFRVRNPRNTHTVPIKRSELMGFLPGCVSVSRSLTVVPGLARRLGRLTDKAYRMLGTIPFVRTHRLVVWRV